MTKQAEHFDIAVVGAGPAGAYLAQKMASDGRKVVLFDPKAPWEKPCGGGITPKAWSRFPILNSPSLPRHAVYQSLQVSPSGRFFVIDEGNPLLMASRLDLSKLMLDQAVAQGVIHLPVTIKQVARKNDLIILTGTDEEFTADFVVGADGVHSVVRKAFLGRLPKERTLTGICRFYEGGPDDPTMIQVTPFPGYVWAFAHADRLTVGVGSMEHGHDLKPHLESFMEKFFPGRKPLTPVAGAVLPHMNGWKAYREQRTGDNWALIGDAAGFCDTMTGEGILYAVWSADLLAKALLAGNIKSYEKSWRRSFGPHLLLGGWLSKRLFVLKNIDRFFSALTVCPSLRRTFLNFVWNQPSYTTLSLQLLAAVPRSVLEWRRFKKSGGVLTPAALGQFAPLADRLLLKWN